MAGAVAMADPSLACRLTTGRWRSGVQPHVLSTARHGWLLVVAGTLGHGLHPLVERALLLLQALVSGRRRGGWCRGSCRRWRHRWRHGPWRCRWRRWSGWRAHLRRWCRHRRWWWQGLGGSGSSGKRAACGQGEQGGETGRHGLNPRRTRCGLARRGYVLAWHGCEQRDHDRSQCPVTDGCTRALGKGIPRFIAGVSKRGPGRPGHALKARWGLRFSCFSGLYLARSCLAC